MTASINPTLRDHLIDAYFEYEDNWDMATSDFASHYGLTLQEAELIVTAGYRLALQYQQEQANERAERLLESLEETRHD